jgi:hypothetical protein
MTQEKMEKQILLRILYCDDRRKKHKTLEEQRDRLTSDVS